LKELDWQFRQGQNIYIEIRGLLDLQLGVPKRQPFLQINLRISYIFMTGFSVSRFKFYRGDFAVLNFY